MDSYSTIIAYHGCRRSVANDVLQGKYDLKPSMNSYDWLGKGIYFWVGDPKRAFEWARKDKNIKDEPYVIGAVIQCKNVIDLATVEATSYLSLAYDNLMRSWEKEGKKPEENKPFRDGDIDVKNRRLDCSVVDYLCETYAEQTNMQIDAVVSPFFEGESVYPTAMFKKYTHTQIAVRNVDCILGYFFPKKHIKYTA